MKAMYNEKYITIVNVVQLMGEYKRERWGVGMDFRGNLQTDM